MKRALLLLLALSVVVTAGCVTYQTPPPVAYAAPPPGPRGIVTIQPAHLYFVPNLQVYFVPDVNYELFFFTGRWYMRFRSEWYWGGSYRGPWTNVIVGKVPRNLRKLPRNYRSRRHEYRRVPYGYWNQQPGKIGWRADYEPRDRDSGPSYERPGPYPGTVIERPSNLYLIPGLSIYFVPEISFEIFFSGSLWYQRIEGNWYSGPSYRGPWRILAPKTIPKKFRKIPRDYRKRYREYDWVPYGYWEKRDRRDRDDDDDDKHKKKKKKKWRDRDDDDDDYEYKY